MHGLDVDIWSFGNDPLASPDDDPGVFRLEVLTPPQQRPHLVQQVVRYPFQVLVELHAVIEDLSPAGGPGGRNRATRTGPRCPRHNIQWVFVTPPFRFSPTQVIL